MAARRLWIELALELCLYALLIALAQTQFELRMSIVALVTVITVPAAMLLIRALLVVASFRIAAACDTDSDPLHLQQWTRMVAREVNAFVRFQSHIRRGRTVKRPTATSIPSDQPLVILLHGIYCNGGVWRPVLDDLSARTGCEILAPTLSPTTAGLEVQTAHFGRWLEGVSVPGDNRKLIVIAHSMGGLVVRLHLHKHPTQTRIARVICIGTPHGGSRIAHALGTAIGRDLRTDASILRELAAAPLRVDLLNIFAPRDNLVVPSSNSQLAGASSLAIPACGHMSLIYSPVVRDRLAAEIAAMSMAPRLASGFH
jgi:triacylglycerol lipase